MATLLARSQAQACIAPSMREVEIEANAAAMELARRLSRGELRDALLILLTGVGTRALLELAERVVPREALIAGINQLTVLVRGPKPVPVCKEWGIHIDLRAPEPNTWREVIALLDETHTPLEGRTVIVQEYGAPSTELCEELRSRGARVETVPVYRWDLPLDRGPLEDAVRRAAAGEFDVWMFTSAQQLRHVLLVAGELGLAEALRRAADQCVLASIGPTTTEAILEAGWPAPFEPTHPKMGHLVREACEFAGQRIAARSPNERR